MTKNLYYLYDKFAENIVMVGIYDSDTIAFRDFNYFLTMRKLDVSQFAVYLVDNVDFEEPCYSVDLEKEFRDFNIKLKNVKEVKGNE